MKKIILIILFSYFIFAQESTKEQSVELPQFVITGKQTIEFPVMSKIQPELITTISQEFIKPAFSSEDLKVREFTDPLKKGVQYFDLLNYLKGNLFFASGLYSLPKASFMMNQVFPNLILCLNIKGENQRKYVDNSERYFLSGLFNLDYFFDNMESFLPRSEIHFKSSINENVYKLFSSPFPTTQRKLFYSDIDFTLKDVSSQSFNYQINVVNNFTKISSENFSENNLNLFGSAALKFKYYELHGNVKFINQTLTNIVHNRNTFKYFFADGIMELKIAKTMKIDFGINYSKADTNLFLSPTVALSVKLDKGIFLFGQFSSSAEYITQSDFLIQNKYYNSSFNNYFFFKKNSSFLFAIKYEYQRFFEINGGFKYFSSDNHPYFTDENSIGIFNLASTKARNVNIFLKLQFHPGPLGYFYCEVNANDVSDSLRNKIPYSSFITGSLFYAYKFTLNLNGEIGLKYFSKSYADLKNTIPINSFIDASLKLTYYFTKDFQLILEADNFTNNKNYFWNNYKEIPANVTLGFNYKW